MQPVRLLLSLIAALMMTVSAAAQPVSADPLSDWNDSPTKTAIVDFVKAVTTEGAADFLPPEQRIAVFDNDGTLWTEQPLYFQFLFQLDRIKAMAPQHPEWQSEEPFASILKGDIKAAFASKGSVLAGAK